MTTLLQSYQSHPSQLPFVFITNYQDTIFTTNLPVGLQVKINHMVLIPYASIYMQMFINMFLKK